MDKLAFLDGDSPAEPAAEHPVEAAPAAAPTPEPAPEAQGQPRGPDGKFAAKTTDEAASAAEPAPVSAEPATPPAEPAAAAPAEPDELTKLRGTVEALNKALTQERALRRQQATAPAPDPQADPDGYEQHQEREQALTFEWSFKALALTQGQDTAKKVAEWARDLSQTDPGFYERALSSPDPAGFAFAEFQRNEALTMLMDPSFRERFAAFTTSAANPNPAPAVTVAPPQPPSTPPQSLAAVPNAGGAKPGAIPTGPGVAFDMTFKD